VKLEPWYVLAYYSLGLGLGIRMSLGVADDLGGVRGRVSGTLGERRLLAIGLQASKLG
jgi:hypothetical protein